MAFEMVIHGHMVLETIEIMKYSKSAQDKINALLNEFDKLADLNQLPVPS